MNASAMTKTAALKIARNAVSMPSGRGTSWVIYHPYRHATLDDLRGPSTSRNASSYAGALAMRSRTVADITLSLMGINSIDAQAAIYNASPCAIIEMVNIGIETA